MAPVPPLLPPPGNPTRSPSRPHRGQVACLSVPARGCRSTPSASRCSSCSMQPQDSGIQYSRWDGGSRDAVHVAAVGSTGEASSWER